MSITLFLADDHAVLRDGLKALLEMQPDLQVVGMTGDGTEAVRQVEQLSPHIAILDIAMPGISGIEATRRIRQRCPQTRVIILSMYHTAEHISQALQSGARGYLLKETASEEVIEAVRAVHQGRRYLSPEVAVTAVEFYLGLQEEAPPSPLERLTAREREILRLLAEGKSRTEIADLLVLSPRTIDNYRNRLMRKLNIDHFAGLVKFALRHGLTTME
jgi:DNA-binding NarL/FixJ family response regulator